MKEDSVDGMQVGIRLVSGVLSCGALGYFLDRWLGLSPLLMVAGLLLGAAAGFMSLIRASHEAPQRHKETNDGMDT